MKTYNTVILGAGAAGMMAASVAAKTGNSVYVFDHAMAPGEKIRISGGGRCNFTNIHASSQNFLSANKHFAKSALSSYSASDFVGLVKKHKIPFHEKTLGQLFCDNSSQDIIKLLLDEMEATGVELALETHFKGVTKSETGFELELESHGKRFTVKCQNLVVACGGKSIPKMGATGLAYDIAEHFRLPVTEVRPALVPLTFSEQDKMMMQALSGVSTDAKVSFGKTAFDEAILFTHRGLSGPAILQISSYWREKQSIIVNLMPSINSFELLKKGKQTQGKKTVQTILSDHLPKRLVAELAPSSTFKGNIADIPDKSLHSLSERLNSWTLYPIGTEGYRTAEVTLGGIDTKSLNSKTMECKSVAGLYFIGEAVDVTGWLGGYNFQWAWSSAFATGTAISKAL